MAHAQRIYADIVYVNGAPIPSAYFESLDAAQAKVLNGDAGGSWAPTNPIRISGAGAWCAGPWLFSSGAQIRNIGGSGARITHAANDWFQLEAGHVGQTRILISPMRLGRDASPATATIPLVTYENIHDGLRFLNVGGGRAVCPIALHHGATLLYVSLDLTVSSAHSGVGSPPASMPLIRVFSVDTLGNVTNLFTAARSIGWVGNGFSQIPTPASGTAWYNGGTPHTFTYGIDAGTIVDNTKYTYFCEIVDESGANSFTGNNYLGTASYVYYIPDLRPQ
jgi:hypothetical protein